MDTQSQRYLNDLPPYVRTIRTPLPFAYESTGVETTPLHLMMLHKYALGCMMAHSIQ